MSTATVPSIGEITVELVELGWPPVASQFLHDDRVVVYCQRAKDDTLRLVATGSTAHDAYLRVLKQAREMAA